MYHFFIGQQSTRSVSLVIYFRHKLSKLNHRKQAKFDLDKHL